jgi:hypothetical protein
LTAHLPHAPRRLHLVALVVAAGCHPAAPPPDLSLDPRALLVQVEAAQARVRAVQGEARVRVDARGMSGAVTQYLAAEEPDRLHVEALDFFGNPLLVLAAGGGRFALYDAREKVFYRGAATPGNLARLVPLALSAEELVRILCGSAPLLGGAPVAAEPRPGFVWLELKDGDRTQGLRVGAGGAVIRSTVRVAGARAPGTYDLAFEDLEPRGGVPFPKTVTLRSARPRVELDVRWREVEVNPALDPALFRLDPPRGARVVELAPEGGEPPPDLFRDAVPLPAPPAGSPRGGSVERE